MSDRPPRYGMIVLDETPYVLRARGVPLIFTSPEETLEYARLHGIEQWMVFGDPDGWWPVFTQGGAARTRPEKKRVDITLRQTGLSLNGARVHPSSQA